MNVHVHDLNRSWYCKPRSHYRSGTAEPKIGVVVVLLFVIVFFVGMTWLNEAVYIPRTLHVARFSPFSSARLTRRFPTDGRPLGS
jgi:hypothetical protein